MRTILVVDDEAVIVELLVELLEDAGYRVISAKHGREALQRMAEVRPDLVLTDVMMPVMDGRDLCKVIRATPEYQGIPVVLMSAARDSVHRSDCAYDKFIAKPFEIDLLLQTIDELLDSRADDQPSNAGLG